MRSDVDEIDTAILGELVNDSKTSIKELARKLRIHPNTVMQRVKRLEKSGIIMKYTTVVNYEKVGYGLQALIFINVRMGKGWEAELKPVARLPQVSSFLLLTGEYDALAIVRLKDKDELSAILRKIQDTNIVVKTTTHLILDYYKYSYEYNPLKEEGAK